MVMSSFAAFGLKGEFVFLLWGERVGSEVVELEMQMREFGIVRSSWV